MKLYKEGKYERALAEFRKEAERGQSDTQFVFGLMHVLGKGTPKNHKEAVKWYRRAAEQENARGQLNLGNAYQNGLGLNRNSTEAAKW